MKAGMRMMAINNARRNRERMEGGGSMEMRGGQMGMEYGRMGGEEMRRGGGRMEMGGDYPESRFRDVRGRKRDSDGRYAQAGAGGQPESRYPFWPPVYEDRMEGSQMNRIGFDMTGDDRRDHIFGEEFERKQKQSEMAYMGGDEMGIRHGKKERGHAESYEDSEPMDMETAKRWVSRMKNKDGTMGAHWSMDQAKSMMQQHGLSLEPVEFWAILNAMYSDFSAVAKKHHLSGSDFYVDLAKAWLEDEDAVENKATMYYECVVKHE